MLIFSLPLGGMCANKLSEYQKIILKYKDERVNIINESILGIKILKYFAYENQYINKISNIRKNELLYLKFYLIAQSLLEIIMYLLPTLVGLVSFLIHTLLLHKKLSPSVGFTSLLLFNMLKWPLSGLPEIVNFLVRALISIKRIEIYLHSKDVKGMNKERDIGNDNENNNDDKSYANDDDNYSNSNNWNNNDKNDFNNSTNNDKNNHTNNSILIGEIVLSDVSFGWYPAASTNNEIKVLNNKPKDLNQDKFKRYLYV